MNKRIEIAQRNLECAQENLSKVVRRIVLTCPHKHVAECSEMDGADWRVCLDCGLTDEGWGCGYQVLTPALERVGSISRDKLLNIRTASLWQQNYGKPIHAQVDKFLGIKAKRA